MRKGLQNLICFLQDWQETYEKQGRLLGFQRDLSMGKFGLWQGRDDEAQKTFVQGCLQSCSPACSGSHHWCPDRIGSHHCRPDSRLVVFNGTKKLALILCFSTFTEWCTNWNTKLQWQILVVLPIIYVLIDISLIWLLVDMYWEWHKISMLLCSCQLLSQDGNMHSFKLFLIRINFCYRQLG